MTNMDSNVESAVGINPKLVFYAILQLYIYVSPCVTSLQPGLFPLFYGINHLQNHDIFTHQGAILLYKLLSIYARGVLAPTNFKLNSNPVNYYCILW